MPVLFRRTKLLENQIDEFLDAVDQGVIVFKHGLQDYLDGESEKFDERLSTIDIMENRADDLRRKAENHLYSHSLIPEHRGDVLGLLEHMDDVVDAAKETLNLFAIETPEIDPVFHKDYMDLAEMAVNAAESVVLAARAFFRDVNAVKNHLHKVYFYEKEADQIAYRLKRKIFVSDHRLSIKMHQRYFAQNVDNLADIAEAVADRIAIYAIKRTH
jgi:predicted phosphate transport protein (TIGR00153 family)